MTTSLQKQLPALLQWPPSCTSNYQFCTSDHLPAAAITFLHQQQPVLHQRLPSCSSEHLLAPAVTSPEPTTTFLHQRIPVLNQQPPSCISRYQSCTSDHLSKDYQSYTSYPDLHQRIDPALTITIRPQWLFAVRYSNSRFAIIKFGLSKQHLCFVLLAKFVVNHLYFKILRGPLYLSASATVSSHMSITPSPVWHSLHMLV